MESRTSYEYLFAKSYWSSHIECFFDIFYKTVIVLLLSYNLNNNMLQYPMSE